ncbi:MAG TPA: ETX/MTX2 family pore-forming toxin, partial [Chloroflexia bacterium]
MAVDEINLDKVASEFIATQLLLEGRSVVVTSLDYSKLCLQLNPAGLEYDAADQIYSPLLVAEVSYVNNGRAEDTQALRVGKTTIDSFSWSLTESIEVGVTTSFSVKAPIFAEGKVEVSMAVSFSATQTQSKEEVQNWELDTGISIPPHTRVKVTATVRQSRYDPTFTADVWITGEVRAYYIYYVGSYPRGRLIGMSSEFY